MGFEQNLSKLLVHCALCNKFWRISLYAIDDAFAKLYVT